MSNIGKTSAGSDGLFDKLGQGFTTGPGTSPHSLTSIDVKVTTAPSSTETLTATVRRADADDNPGEVHATLTPPASIVRGNNTFMALAGTTLAAGTKYFVVIETDDPGRGDSDLAQTHSTGQDGVTGWDIDNSRQIYQSATWFPTPGSPYQIRVNGTATAGSPVLTAAEVKTDGHSIVLTFNEILDHPTYTTTIRSAFTVTVDGTDTSVISTSCGMDKVNLSVSNTIAEGQTVVVSYDRSDAGTEAIGDSDGNKVADFTTGRDGVPAVVNSSEVDRSPPELTGATVTSSGVAIELAFDEDLDLPATIPAALKDAFSVTADGDTVAISSVAADGSSGLQINLSSRILKDQAVVVSYDESAAGANALDDDAGNEVADFTTGSGGVPRSTTIRPSCRTTRP